MRLREKDKKDGEPVTLGWDEAQAALAAGTHEPATEETGVEATGTAAREPGGGAPVEGDDLDGKTKAELEALAKERGLDLGQAKTKAEIVEALRKA